MLTGILKTKLYKPVPRSNLVLRARLSDRLDQGLAPDRRLILVSAPAGSGKTTLLGEWLDSRKVTAAWLSLDEGDNDPVRFWSYVIAALQTVEAGLGDGILSLLDAPQPAPVQVWLPDLLNEIANLSGPLVLVVDDYHVVASTAVHESLSFFLEHLPPSLRLVISTRADPPLPLARLRARAQMVECRAADLRFTSAEALAFLNEGMGLALQSGQVESLLGRTEGWAVGLQLAGLSLQGHANPGQLIESFTGGHHYVLEYLIEEVLGRQPEQVQQFLARTAILDHLSGPLCDAVTGQANSAVVLADLYRMNLFLVPLDDEHVWYRYHHLFRDLLRARLDQSDPDITPVLHRRASDWFAEHEYPMEAVQHALAARDYARAADLIEAYAPARWALSDTAFLTTIGKLPMELVASRPALAIHHAFALLLLGHHHAAETLLHAMLPNIPAEPDAEKKGIASFAALLLVYIAELMGKESSVQLPDVRSLEYVPEHRLAMRNTADVTYAFLLHFRGEFDRAVELLMTAVRRDIAANGTTAIPIAVSRIGRIRIVQGRLRETVELCREYLKRLQELDQRRFYIGGSLNLILGDVFREWNDLDAAEREIRYGVEVNQSWPSPESNAIGQLLLGRLLLARGNTEGALEALEQVDRTIHGHLVSPDLMSDIQGLRVRLWLAQGNARAASEWAEQLVPDPPLDFRHERDQITRARVLLAQDQAAQAHMVLERLKDAAERGGRAGRRIEIGLLNALALNAHQDPAKARQELEYSLALAEPEGYRRLFVDEGEPARVLISEWRRHSADAASRLRDYADDLLAAFPQVTAAGSEHPAVASPQASLVEPLTPRELEVLQLVCAGHSNQEIADKLVITINGVKKHTVNIFGKLGVTSRAQAMVKAHQLGLVVPDR